MYDFNIYYPTPSMYRNLNPILKDKQSDFSQAQYIHGTYRMMFLKYKGVDNEDNSPEM